MGISDVLKSNAHNKTTTSKIRVGDLFSISDDSNNGDNLDSDMNLRSLGDKKEDTSLITFVNDIFLNAFKQGASDIHIEPRTRSVNIRFRIDGNFIAYKTLNIAKKDSLIARIKILSYLRIDEHRLPQDGKINYKLFGGKSIDMRISIIPTIYGEKCVIRILKKDDTPPELKDLGIMPYNMVKIKKHLKDSYGMILAVGPTGSGKTTTLFSLLSQFNAEEQNISTLEDPVEYRIPGVNHTQINPAISFTFAKGLRSLLRQDPDIIMVGEIRDEETAKLAVEASITGHIVFSTIHTNSATHTIQRLVNLGVDPLLISSSLRTIISQRLARKLCNDCKQAYNPSPKIRDYIVSKVGKYLKNKEDLVLYKSPDKGCDKCNHTGYKGRVGLYEVLEMTDQLESLMLKNASRLQLEIQAVGDGMVPIKEDGLMKVVMGETSIEEILSVLGT
ncbi:type II/IV secretion system protein [Candidatus Gracilibacteria bacterium 28_42_T64]|nr:type II/IV secretion system protein [Candidatus Gracilibacteria bacterium 28_42_T64]